MNHFKTVETNTEPAFIITNDLGEHGGPNAAILLLSYWYTGDDEEVAPKPTMGTDGVIYLTKEEIPKLIAALEEFL